uniref:Uncharacterized protein n=1 Tax=Avena sativa TaxID=4498 RepID=A0ACD6A6F3_AVESA
MDRVWDLPSEGIIYQASDNWMQMVIQSSPSHMVDCILLVAWRHWFVRNEVTHDKPLPTIGSSKRFRCAYLKLLQEIQAKPTVAILKGKDHVVMEVSQKQWVPKKGPDKPWCRPKPGWVKLTVDGSFYTAKRSAGAGIIL